MIHREQLIVIFRHEQRQCHPLEQVVAVFPEEPGTDWEGLDMCCYVALGQHSVCDMDWYRRTRPATPIEYADLLAEITALYSDYDLVIRRQISPTMRAVNAAERRITGWWKRGDRS